MNEIFDGKTLTVFVSMKFTRRGARKRIVAPDGTALAPVTKPQPNGKLMTALVRAWRWQKLIEAGQYASVMGLLFLRHATNRYYDAKAAIDADKAAGRMPNRPLVDGDFTKRRALNLPEAARFDLVLEAPKDGTLGAALTTAMEEVEERFTPLRGQLPTDYERFDDDLLESMMREVRFRRAYAPRAGTFSDGSTNTFLAEFSKQGAHDNGEFFTPPSIVQTIVNVIEPDHGIVFDPACGSGGMFVQSSHFIEDAGRGHS